MSACVLIQGVNYMGKVFIFLSIILLLVSCAMFEEEVSNDFGAISGRISPQDVSLRIIAKTAGTEYNVKKNIKGEITLTTGGVFTIENLPAGKYDLIFFLHGKSKEKYLTTRWSEVVVEAGRVTAGIDYRLTPIGSNYLIDEILVAFKGNIQNEDAQKIIRSLGCTIKDRPVDNGKVTIYTIDIPKEKGVEDMIRAFKKKESVEYAEPNIIISIN